MLKTLCVLTLIGVAGTRVVATGQTGTMREVPNRARAIKSAPAECIKVFRAFFAYVQKREPSILADQKAQERWLSQSMRKALAAHIQRSGKPQENPDYPSNQSFVGVWDDPTTFSIIGSRHYDYRNSDNPDDNRAVIDVLYEWSKTTPPANNYPGEKSLKSFVFVYEDGAWKLDDVYTFSDKFATPESLRAHFDKG